MTEEPTNQDPEKTARLLSLAHEFYMMVESPSEEEQEAVHYCLATRNEHRLRDLITNWLNEERT